MTVLKEIEGLVFNQIQWIKTCVSLTKLEAKLAGLSVVPFLITLFFLLSCLISVWILTMGLIGYLGFLISHDVLLSLVGLLLLNAILFNLLFYCLMRNLKNMSFEKTRAYLSNSREHADHDVTQKTNPRNKHIKSSKGDSASAHKATQNQTS